MAVDDADILGVLRLDLRQHGRKRCATGSLKIAIFRQGDAGVFRPVNPVQVADRREDGALGWAGSRSWADHGTSSGLLSCDDLHPGGRDCYRFRCGWSRRRGGLVSLAARALDLGSGWGCRRGATLTSREDKRNPNP